MRSYQLAWSQSVSQVVIPVPSHHSLLGALALGAQVAVVLLGQSFACSANGTADTAFSNDRPIDRHGVAKAIQ